MGHDGGAWGMMGVKWVVEKLKYEDINSEVYSSYDM